jgi:hypothetical protein
VLDDRYGDGKLRFENVRLQRCRADSFLVGKHPGGASPLGLEDALLTRAELLVTSDDAFFGACRNLADPSAKSSGACLVYGLAPGAIDSVERLPLAQKESDSEVETELATMPYGFRCVWGGEASK